MIAKDISNLNSRKAVLSDEIWTKMWKEFEVLFATFIYNKYSSRLLGGTFPEDLRTVVPDYKKEKRPEKSKLFC